MLASDFINFVQKQHLPTCIGIEDFADKFNFLITPTLLIIVTIIISTKQYVFSSLSCVCYDNNGLGDYKDFANNFCWITGVYKMTVKEAANSSRSQLAQSHYERLSYYQWVPLVLGCQCILYYFPRMIWLSLVTNRLGSDCEQLVKEAAKAGSTLAAEERRRMTQHIAGSLLRLRKCREEYSDGKRARIRQKLFHLIGPLLPGKRLGTSLVFSYFVVKLLYIVNALGQIVLTMRFIGVQDLRVLFKEGSMSKIFPKIGFCFPEFLTNGKLLQASKCQCALPLNMLNEHLYRVLLVWTLAAALLTAWSLLSWMHRLLLARSRRRFVKRLLLLRQVLSRDSLADSRLRLHEFCFKFLRHDGVFLFKMLQLNAGDVIAGDVLAELFLQWSHMRQEDAKRLAAKQKDDSEYKNAPGPISV